MSSPDFRTQLQKNLDYNKKIAIAKKLEQSKMAEMYKKLMISSQTENKPLDTNTTQAVR